MKTIKSMLAALLVIPAFIGVMAIAQPAKASTNNDLGNLIVTNGLFTGYDAQDLAGLIAVDSVTGGGGSFSGTSNLNDLIVLGGLFGTGGWGWHNNAEDLAGLIAVDNLYNGGM